MSFTMIELRLSPSHIPRAGPATGEDDFEFGFVRLQRWLPDIKANDKNTFAPVPAVPGIDNPRGFSHRRARAGRPPNAGWHGGTDRRARILRPLPRVESGRPA